MASHVLCDCQVMVVLRFWDMGHQFLNPSDFADNSISKDCWMLQQRVTQKTGIGWGTKVTALPALMYYVLFYSSLYCLDASVSYYITCNILLDCFLMRTVLFWNFTQQSLLLTFWDILQVPFARVKQSKKNEGTLRYTVPLGMVWAVTGSQRPWC